jgi:hypothetical protein
MTPPMMRGRIDITPEARVNLRLARRSSNKRAKKAKHHSQAEHQGQKVSLFQVVLSSNTAEPKCRCFVRPSQSIAVRHGERSGGEANTTVSSVEDGVKTLKERIAVDEVEAPSGEFPNVVDDQINIVRFPAEERIERAWPNLRVRGEFERASADSEEERLEVGELRRCNAEEIRLEVNDRPGRVAIAVERV